MVSSERARNPAEIVEILRRGLEAEQALLNELARGLIDQRQAIAVDDTAALEQLVPQLSRTLLTLREARVQRGLLVEMVTGRSDARLADVFDSLPAENRAGVATLCRSLREQAVAASRELTINQTVIRRAIESGERFLQQLLTTPNLALYRNQPEPEIPGGLLLNQRA